MLLDTCPNQFGFKKRHSTDMCIYVLKEITEYFKSRSTSVFVTVLDAPKAYDKIDHWQLFNKLLHIHVLVFIVNILVYWYSHQEMFIRWGNSCSTKCLVLQGSNEGVYCPNISLMCVASGIPS